MCPFSGSDEQIKEIYSVGEALNLQLTANNCDRSL